MSIGGTPVGNMVIKVDLDAAGVEKSMTGLQRQLRHSNTAMGAQLSAFSRGEKSAEKYGVQISGLTNRHRIQGAMVQQARAHLQDMNKTHGEGSVKSQEAAQALNRQIAMYEQTGRELSAMQAEFKEFQRVQEIQSKGWYKAADGMDRFGGHMKAVGAGMDRTGKKLTRGVTLPLAVVGGLAIKTGSDFEAGMSKVGAVSGASSQDMKKLEDMAREMGKTTVFSAKEASDAFYYMSLAGWDATESMDGIGGVMDLAAASGEDLAQVADIVTDGLTAFGLEAKHSGRMADVLAAASANANTDVSGLGQAFSYVAPVAGALGYTIEDTSLAIGLMSNAGIKSTKAGTALRTMMTNLSKPTAEAKKAMDKYGISLTDSSGEMKSFDEIMQDLRVGIGGLSEDQQAQAASTIFGKEAMSGALAIINASEEDYEKLSLAIQESDGAAADMADTMQDNLQGSLKELKSMVEDLFITLYQNLKPALEGVVDSAKNLTEWLANLSPKTQENILKFGLLAAAIGPVLSITGKLTYGMGALVQGSGILIKTIGLGGGSGLVGALAALGPAAIGGIAVAGLGAIALAVYNLRDDTVKLEKVNLDLANSLSDQAIDLQASADKFDTLSNKAKISNAELAELNDINKRISESSNPAVIEELQKQYDNLARKSGLSKDELKELFTANENIIDQSPNVEASISEQGNAFVKSTEAVHEYIQELLEMSRQELSDEIKIAAENKTAALKEQKELQAEMNSLNDASLQLSYLEKLSEEERYKTAQHMHTENKQAQLRYRDDQEKVNALKDEEEILVAYINDGLAAGLEKIKEQREELNKKVDKNDEELAKLNALDEEMSNIVLKQVGINEEGEKGLAVLDESLAKDKEKLAELEKQKGTKDGLTEKEKEQYQTLTEKVAKQSEAKEFLIEELGIYKDLNSLAEHSLETASKEVQKKVESLGKTAEIKVEEGNIVGQLQKKNTEHDKAIGKLEQEREKQGANKGEIDKQITSLESKKAKNSEVVKKILEELGLWKDLDVEIKNGINSEIKKGNAVDGTKGKLDAQGNAIDGNNSKTDKGIQKEKDRSKEAGRSVNKDVKVSDKGTVAFLDKMAQDPKNKTVSAVDSRSTLERFNTIAQAPKNKTVSAVDSSGSLNRFDSRATSSKNKTLTAVDSSGSISRFDGRATSSKTKTVTALDRGSIANLDRRSAARKTKTVTATDRGSISNLNRRASSPVSKTINFIGKGLSKLKFWAKGTPPEGHPGGAAVIGEEGSELVTLPGGKSFLSPGSHTLLDLPKGTHVTPHEETKRIMKNVPRYAEGTSGYADLFSFDRLKDNEFMKLLALNDKQQSQKPGVVSIGNRGGTNKDDEGLSLLKKQVELLTELVLSNKNIANKPTLTDRDVTDAVNNRNAWDSIGKL